MLTKRAIECDIPVNTLKDYLESFSMGAFPHGGCGIGLERVVMLYADLKNIRKTSMFPRTPNRLFP
jgi:aspartyl-tRNA synthetase